ncbi:MAG TPA: hypothetical protein VF731_06440 [Solirubrobacterales bacterium]
MDEAVAQLDDAVGAAGELAAVGDEQRGASRRQSLDRGGDRELRLLVEVGGRLVEQQQRRVAQEGAGSASRCAWPAESGRPPSPTRVARPSGRLPTSSSSPAWRIAAITRQPEASGSARRTFSRIVPAKIVGRCGTQPICRRQAAGSTSRRSTPPQAIEPAPGSARRSSSESSVVLPPPLGPTRATVSPGSISSSTPRRTSARPGCEKRRPLSTRLRCRGSGAATGASGAATAAGWSRISKIRSAAAIPSALAWNWLPRRRSGR